MIYIRKDLKYGLKFKGIEKCDLFYHFINTGYWSNKEFISKCYLKVTDMSNENTNNTINDVDENNSTDDEIENVSFVDKNYDNYVNNNNYENDDANNYDIDNYYLNSDIKNKCVFVSKKARK